MNEQLKPEELNALPDEAADLFPSPDPTPIPHWPWFISASGLYQWRLFDWPFAERSDAEVDEGAAADQPISRPIPIWTAREELRLDVDGRNPQMTVSGTRHGGLTSRVHWIANLSSAGTNHWTGTIWYKNGNTASFPYTQVDVTAIKSFFPGQRKATVKFSGGGSTSTRAYRFKSNYFHEVEFEFDSVKGTTATTAIDSCAHPNRPASLPCETLTLEKMFQRAGFNVKKSGNDSVIPIPAAGANQTWSDMEMHDAMQVYWSRFADQAQWSMWTLFAGLHDQGTSLGGIMFDDIGPNHRQGTAIFNDSFISNAPNNDPNPAAWVERMKFWTAIHEMGHSFNLAHSWQKAHPPNWGTPWIPLSNEPEVRSFMNYPYNVAGGQTAFFADFEFRFSDQELLFMRHAPAEFVQMGNADWFEDHGFRESRISPEPKFRLEVRANRPTAEFEFLEPVVLEIKLTNISGQPQVVAEDILSQSDDMTVILQKRGGRARQWAPYAQYCREDRNTVLGPGDSLYESLFVAAGRNGWDLAEPGIYTVQMALHLDEEDVVSAPIKVRVAPSQGYDEDYVAQDFFSDEVGRVLAFDGSRVLDAGNDCLHEVAERLPKRRVATHALIALGNPLSRSYKRLAVGAGRAAMAPAGEVGGRFEVLKAEPGEAKKALETALFARANTAAETLGHVGYKYYVDQFSDSLDKQGRHQDAAKCQSQMHKALKSRKVLPKVLASIEKRGAAYGRKG
jgi:hypothetical protein